MGVTGKKRIASLPDLRPKIEQQDMQPTAPGHVEFNAVYRAELARWTKVSKDAGLKAD